MKPGVRRVYSPRDSYVGQGRNSRRGRRRRSKEEEERRRGHCWELGGALAYSHHTEDTHRLRHSHPHDTEALLAFSSSNPTEATLSRKKIYRSEVTDIYKFFTPYQWAPVCSCCANQSDYRRTYTFAHTEGGEERRGDIWRCCCLFDCCASGSHTRVWGVKQMLMSLSQLAHMSTRGKESENKRDRWK